MQPNKTKQKRSRSALLLAVALVLTAAATVAGATGWAASAKDTVAAFVQRDEFRALAAVLSVPQPDTNPAAPAAEAQPTNLAHASLCWWETLIQ